MSLIKNFIKSFATQATHYDESDGQFMFFANYPHSKSRNRPLSSAELRTRQYNEERENSLIKIRAEVAKANYRSNKTFNDIHRKKI